MGVNMKTKLRISKILVINASLLAFSLGMLFTPTAQALSEVDLRKNCETKRDANACFVVGMADLRKNTPATRKLARHSLKQACAIQKHKKSCSKTEAKTVAKAYLANQGRIPASKGMIKAPRISNPGARASNSAQPSYEPPYNDPPPPPIHSYEPVPQMAQPPPMPQMPGMPGMDNGQCLPGDPSCS
jgi:hypothetical protein